jgi:DNA-binding response OmpR family regulator
VIDASSSDGAQGIAIMATSACFAARRVDATLTCGQAASAPIAHVFNPAQPNSGAGVTNSLVDVTRSLLKLRRRTDPPTRPQREGRIALLGRKILVVDDDPDILDLIVFLVGRTGLAALPARDPVSAMALFEVEQPDMALVDVTLGPSSGIDLVAQLRARSDLPIVLLSARSSEDDKVRGLDAGADDYLTKPFSHRELVARIAAQLRRARSARERREQHVILRVGPLTLNVAQHAADKEGRSLQLTATEFRLLHCLMDRASTVVPTKSLLREVWGYDDAAARDVLRVTLYRLRRKLEDDPRSPQMLRTIPGVGVMLTSNLSDASTLPALS